MFRKTLVLAMAFLLLAASIFAGGAEVLEINGVGYFYADSQWNQIEAGSIIPSGARIFNSSYSVLRLDVAGDIVEVAPLTDFQLMSARDEGEASVLYVRSGGLRAQVVSARSGEEGIRFQIQSPVATASVRGTVFTFNGSELVVEEGDVQLENILGQKHSVREDQKSRAYGNENIASVERYFRRNTSVD
jgi:hypothetical protein